MKEKRAQHNRKRDEITCITTPKKNRTSPNECQYENVKLQIVVFAVDMYQGCKNFRILVIFAFRFS